MKYNKVSKILVISYVIFFTYSAFPNDFISINFVETTQAGERQITSIQQEFYSRPSDGYIFLFHNIFNTVWSATDGTVSSSGVDYIKVTCTKITSIFWIHRGFLFFDTSSLPDNCIIQSATLSIYGRSKTGTPFTLTVQKPLGAYPNEPLQPGDYNKDHYYVGDYGGWFDTAGFSTSGYNAIQLSSLGMSMISKTGTSKFCLRHNYDITGYTPSLPESYVTFWTNEKGSDFWPKLTVEYIIPPSVTTNVASNVQGTSATLNGDLTNMGGASVCYVSFEYGINSYDFWTGDVPQYSTGLFYVNVNNLQHGSTYQFRAIAWNGAGTVQGSTKTFFTNQYPITPNNPQPPNGATNIPITTDLSWTGGDPDGDTVYYDVYLDTVNPPLTCVSSDQTETSYTPEEDLDFDTTYYWRIESEDSYGWTTGGLNWNFKTMSPSSPDEPKDPIPNNDQMGISIYLRELKCTVSHPNNLKMDVYFYWNQENLATEIKTDVSSGSQISFNIPIPTNKELSYETEYHWKIKAVDQYGRYAEKEFSFTTINTPIELLEITYVVHPWTYSHHQDGPYCAQSFADESTGSIGGSITYFGDVLYMSTEAMLGTEKIIPDSSLFQDHFTFGMLRVNCDISSCYIEDLGWNNGNAKLRLYYKLYKNNVLIEENDLFIREKQATSELDSWQLPNMQEIWYLEDSIKLSELNNDTNFLPEEQEIKIEFWMNLSVSKFQSDNVEVGFSGEVYRMNFYGYRPDFYVNQDTIITNPKKPRRNEPITVEVLVQNIGECHAIYIGDGAIRGVCRLENDIYGVPVTDVSYNAHEDKLISFSFIWPDRSGHQIKIHFDELNGETEFGKGCFDEVNEDNNRGSKAVSSEYTGFIPGSLITMANGLTQNIENVQVGNYVLATNGYESIEAVKVTYVHYTSAIDITDSFLVINEDLRVTENQLININGEWKPAGQAQLNDIIIQLEQDSPNSIEITSIEWIPEGNYGCYALEVDPVTSGECCYFVNNKLVHE